MIFTLDPITRTGKDTTMTRAPAPPIVRPSTAERKSPDDFPYARLDADGRVVQPFDRRVYQDKAARTLARHQGLEVDDVTRDPRYGVPVSRQGRDLGAVKRATYRDDEKLGDTWVEVNRLKDGLYLLREQGSITQDAYDSGRLFQVEFIRGHYEPFCTTNLSGGARGGGVGIEGLYLRSLKARDYVHHVLKMMGGDGSIMAVAVCHYIGMSQSLKEIKALKGYDVSFWRGAVHGALQIMEADYREMMRGRRRRQRFEGLQDR